MIGWLSEEEYGRFEIKGSTVVVYSKRAAAIRIDVCSAYVFRVWSSKNGIFEKRASFAVPAQEWEFHEFDVEETTDFVLVHTDMLTLEIGKRSMSTAYRLRENGQLLLKEYKEKGMGFGEDGSCRSYWELSKEEHIYGLGEDNDAYEGTMDRRGTTRDLVTGQTINKGCVTADIPIPFFLSTGRNGAGYGFFVDNTYRMEFDMGKENADCFFWSAKGGEAVTYFLYGPAMKDVIGHYTGLTGRPRMLPLWTLGLIQCKCSYWDWDEVDDVIDTLLEKGFPVDSVVFDFDWTEQLHNFKWHPRWKGMSAAKIRAYRERGIHFMVSNTGPMIKKDSSNFADALENGVMALDAQGNTLTCGHYGGELMDFTAPGIKEWIKKQLIPLMDDGVEGWWLDLTEPEGEPVQTLYQGGSREELHNVYSYLSSKAYYDSHREYNPQSRPYILTRTGTPGIQRFSGSIWSGDVYSDYVTFSAHCPEALNTGMSGIPYWTSDIGGFISATYDSSNPNNVQLYRSDAAAHGLLYERWFQFGCFCPITRVHHAGPSEPYRFGALVEESCRHYINLRYQLLPYLYKYMWDTYHNGLSIMRPLVLEYQEDETARTVKDEFMFGESLLVAPVLTENTTQREVYFPKGVWIDWDYGYEYTGGETYEVYAPQNRIPLFVKKGSIIPMISKRQSTASAPWNPIMIDLYPCGKSSFTMYQDDGITTDYETKSMYTETTLDCFGTEDGCSLSISRNNAFFVPSVYEVKLHAHKVAEKVIISGKELPVCAAVSAYKRAEEGIFVDTLEQISYMKFRSLPKETAADHVQNVSVFYGDREWMKTKPGKDMTPQER